MQPLIATLVVCAALVVLYPPAALVVFAAAAAILAFALWRKARERGSRTGEDDAR